MIRSLLAVAVLTITAPSPSVLKAPDKAATDASCRPAPPSLARALQLSDRVIRARVTRVSPDPAPIRGDKREMGVFELTAVEALKGDPLKQPLTQRYDATLYPDLFGSSPCRWSAQPVQGEIWLIAAGRDGEDCAECDGRLDAAHKLYYLAPEGWFGR